MYKVAGRGDITMHALERYAKDSERFESQEIPDIPDDPIEDMQRRIHSAAPNERAAIIREGMSSHDSDVRVISIAMLRSVPPEEQGDIIRLALTGDDLAVVNWCCIELASMSQGKYSKFRDEVISIVDTVIDTKDLSFKARYLGSFFRNAPKEFTYVLYPKLLALVTSGLESSDPQIESQCSDLVERLNAVDRFLFRDIMRRMILDGLSAKKVEERRLYARMIPNLLTVDRASIYDCISAGLYQDDLETWAICASEAEFATSNDEGHLREHIAADIGDVLTDPDREVSHWHIDAIEYAAPDMRKALFALALKRCPELVIEAPLYKKAVFDEKSLVPRARFFKTGSETTLVGRELRGKAIVRHITPKAFKAWKELYEDYDFWSKAGFDYVPVEPIDSFKSNKEGFVEVYSGVLDLSFSAWLNKSQLFVAEIERDIEEIKQLLKARHFEHGHTHNGNFCLRFFRDEKGGIDLSRRPRVYLIDFDQAVSPPSEESATIKP